MEKVASSITTILYLIIVIILLSLAKLSWKRGWKKTGFLLLILGILIVCIPNFDWVKGLSKTAVIGHLNKKVTGLGEQLESYYKLIEELKEELTQQQNKIISQQEALDKTQGELITAQKDLKIQQEKIQNVENIINEIDKLTVYESFSYEDSNRMIVITDGERKATVYLKLKKVPIKKSINLKFHVYSEPEGSYMAYKNILILNWGDSVGQLKDKNFYITYTENKSKEADVGNMELRNDGFVYTNNQKLPVVSDR